MDADLLRMALEEVFSTSSPASFILRHRFGLAAASTAMKEATGSRLHAPRFERAQG